MNPVELRLARTLVDGLEPGDPQEEIHCWHLAAAHLLAAQRIGKSRQEGLSLRAEQIEIGLAVRVMTLADRKSAALDRHRAFKMKAADRAGKAAETAARDTARQTAGALRAQYWETRRRERSDEAAAGGESDALPPACRAGDEVVTPGQGPGQAPRSALGAGAGAPPTGSVPAPEAPGQSPGQAPLSRQRRRALARREKKEARRAAMFG